MLEKASRASTLDLAQLRGARVVRTKHLLFSYLPKKTGKSKIAFSVAKKIAKRAVDRNRLERQCRHAVHLALPALPVHVLGIVRIMDKDTSWDDFVAEINDIFTTQVRA